MNKDERTHLENSIRELQEENQRVLKEFERKSKELFTILHNFEANHNNEMKRLETKLDIYSQQIYRSSFYGAIGYRIARVREWFTKKSNLNQKPILKKLEVKG